ncbi:MAG: DUF4040 domain-containing protein [Alphaproteobacteria bacterium]|nr:DUF4040 domain-containing protein [Alphaproteobacteria bacterium]OJV13881.1 MAG: hypothetical protein BGO27_08300 [Alphaproteobacteria bacterium 33-17]
MNLVFPELIQDIIIYSMLFFLVVIAVMVMRSNNLITKIALVSGFSLIITFIYTLLDAPDVALTEASINAAIGTVLLIAGTIKGKFSSRSQKYNQLLGFIACTLFAIALIYGIKDIYDFSDPNSPVFGETYQYYINNTETEIGIPSFVAAILASYRGFDTMCETLVIAIAAIVISGLLKNNEQPKYDKA